MENEILVGDCAETLKRYPDETFDCIVTDPPYGYSFMGKQWDKALPSLEALKECCRVLKSGAFAFFMSAPRQDVLSRMILKLEEAGFQTGFTSIYWVYATGFPKAQDVSKQIDKRGGAELGEFAKLIKNRREELKMTVKDVAKYFPSKTGGLTGCVWNWENGKNVPTIDEYNKLINVLKLENFSELREAEREVISRQKCTFGIGCSSVRLGSEKIIDLPATEQAKQFDGAFSGFQPKPAVEIIIVCMKPLSEKTYVDQALKNGKGVTWLGDCKIPYESDADIPKQVVDFGKKGIPHAENYGGRHWINERVENGLPVKVYNPDSEGRFPANLLCSDNCLDNGIITKSTGGEPNHEKSEHETYDYFHGGIHKSGRHHNDSGDFSRYFSLDAWFKSKLPEQAQKTYPFMIVPKPAKSEKNKYCENKHPTVKPLKLMSYLVTMGSREGDLILDPFAGSGTTLEAARLLNRKFVGCELTEEYLNVLEARAGVQSSKCPYRNIIEVCEPVKSIEDLEKLMSQEEQDSYYNLLLGVPFEFFDMVRKAYWIDKGMVV